jgi:hypothetical protein
MATASSTVLERPNRAAGPWSGKRRTTVWHSNMAGILTCGPRDGRASMGTGQQVPDSWSAA